jgi:hypothetical protein
MSDAGQLGRPEPDYEKLWTQLKEKVITGADAVAETAGLVGDARKRALLVGFGLAMTAVQRAMEDGEQLGSIEDALNGSDIELPAGPQASDPPVSPVSS